MWPRPIEGEYVKIPTFDKHKGTYGIMGHELPSIDKVYFPQTRLARYIPMAADLQHDTRLDRFQHS